MASYFTLTVDEAAPADPSIILAGGAAATGTRDVSAALSSSSGDVTTMKVYGDVDDAHDPASYRAVEGDAPWIAYATTLAVRLSTGDGTKTVRAKFRDDVLNVSAEVTDTITLDTALPVVNIVTGPDRTKLSLQTGYRTCNFGWQSDTGFDEYKVKIVPATDSIHTAGTVIGEANGSTNVVGSATGYPANTTINTALDAADVQAAQAGGGIVKIFVRTAGGTWSL